MPRKKALKNYEGYDQVKMILETYDRIDETYTTLDEADSMMLDWQERIQEEMGNLVDVKNALSDLLDYVVQGKTIRTEAEVAETLFNDKYPRKLEDRIRYILEKE